jgi:hypothetical protein
MKVTYDHTTTSVQDPVSKHKAQYSMQLSGLVATWIYDIQTIVAVIVPH